MNLSTQIVRYRATVGLLVTALTGLAAPVIAQDYNITKIYARQLIDVDHFGWFSSVNNKGQVAFTADTYFYFGNPSSVYIGDGTSLSQRFHGVFVAYGPNINNKGDVAFGSFTDEDNWRPTKVSADGTTTRFLRGDFGYNVSGGLNDSGQICWRTLENGHLKILRATTTNDIETILDIDPNLPNQQIGTINDNGTPINKKGEIAFFGYNGTLGPAVVRIGASGLVPVATTSLNPDGVSPWFTGLSMNDSGMVATTGGTEWHGNALNSFATGVYVGEGNRTNIAIARVNSTFTGFWLYAAINNYGDVAFMAQTSGGGWGIYTSVGGKIRRVIGTGDIVDGVIINRLYLGTINDNGQISFVYQNGGDFHGIDGVGRANPQFGINRSMGLSSLSPGQAALGQGETTIIVNGAGFSPTSAVAINDTTVPTDFVTSAQLKATFPASAFQIPGKLSVRVTDAGPDQGRKTDALSLVVSAPATTVSAISLPRPTVTKNGSSLSVTIPVKNTGTATAYLLNIVGATMGTTKATSINPSNTAQLAAGASTNVTLTFPASAAPAGTAPFVTLNYNSNNAGTGSLSVRCAAIP